MSTRITNQPGTPPPEDRPASGSPAAGTPGPDRRIEGRTGTARRWLLLLAVILGGGLAYLGWRYFQPRGLPAGFAASNGRVEAVEIDVATKTPGRLVAVLVDEGDFVTAGQVVAQMDTDVLRAQLREAQAELQRSKTAVGTTESTVAQRKGEKAAADSTLLQREAELDLASKRLDREERLARTSATSREDLDSVRAAYYSARAALATAKANMASAEAAINTAKSMVIMAQASVAAAQAKSERIQADIDDSTLKAPRDGRVQYRVAQPGEVLNAGGKVLNMIDLADVYVTFFLPTVEAGRVGMGDEVRVVIDAAPEYVFPARVSYVADVAQFTPKTVETAEERLKLMFRVKARVEPKLLKKYVRSIKTGLPGMAYVRFGEEREWPPHLEVNLPK